MATQYLTYDTAAAAIAVSRRVAVALGCGPVTTHWHAWEVEAERSGAARAVLVVRTERDRLLLTESERGQLADRRPTDWRYPEELGGSA